MDISFAGILRFPDDVLAHFDCSFAAAHRHDLEAVGEEGVIRLADPWHGKSPGIELRRGTEVERIEVERADPYALELEDFERAAGDVAQTMSASEIGPGETRSPLLDRTESVSQARVIEALYASAEQETPKWH